MRLIDADPQLSIFQAVIRHRHSKIQEIKNRLMVGTISLPEFASGKEYFSLHSHNDHWVFREWSPNATAIFLIGDMTDWREKLEFALEKSGDPREWTLSIPGSCMEHKNLYRLCIFWQGGCGERIPSYARRVVQDPEIYIFNAQVWGPPDQKQQTHRSRCPRTHFTA